MNKTYFTLKQDFSFKAGKYRLANRYTFLHMVLTLLWFQIPFPPKHNFRENQSALFIKIYQTNSLWTVLQQHTKVDTQRTDTIIIVIIIYEVKKKPSVQNFHLNSLNILG